MWSNTLLSTSFVFFFFFFFLTNNKQHEIHGTRYRQHNTGQHHTCKLHMQSSVLVVPNGAQHVREPHASPFCSADSSNIPLQTLQGQRCINSHVKTDSITWHVWLSLPTPSAQPTNQPTGPSIYLCFAKFVVLRSPVASTLHGDGCFSLLHVFA